MTDHIPEPGKMVGPLTGEIILAASQSLIGQIAHAAEDENMIWLIRREALNHGYAIAVHGSRGPKDLDLVAVPWTDKAIGAEALVREICQLCSGLDKSGNSMRYFVSSEKYESKPHGRKAFILVNMYTHRIIDLSVMPRGDA